MRRHLVYLLAFLCCALVGCSDDDDGSNQPKYKLVNETGCLYYDKDLEAWIVVPKLGENRLLPDRRLEFGECVYYVIKNVPKNIKELEGSTVLYSGTLVYQSCKQEMSNNVVVNTYVYSLKLSKVEWLDPCPTPAPPPPDWFFD